MKARLTVVQMPRIAFTTAPHTHHPAALGQSGHIELAPLLERFHKSLSETKSTASSYRLPAEWTAKQQRHSQENRRQCQTRCPPWKLQIQQCARRRAPSSVALACMRFCKPPCCSSSSHHVWNRWVHNNTHPRLTELLHTPAEHCSIHQDLDPIGQRRPWSTVLGL